MKAVVTGAKGFVGKNLVVALQRARVDVAEIDIDSPPDALLSAVRGANIVFHLAGVNRPEQEAEFLTGNVGSLDTLFAALDELPATDRQALRPLIVLSSSTQANHDNRSAEHTSAPQ